MATLLHRTLSQHSHFKMLAISFWPCRCVCCFCFLMTFMVSKATVFTLKQFSLEWFYYNVSTSFVCLLGLCLHTANRAPENIDQHESMMTFHGTWLMINTALCTALCTAHAVFPSGWYFQTVSSLQIHCRESSFIHPSII